MIVDRSLFVLGCIGSALFVLLLLLSDALLRAHIDNSILRFSSDASVYYDWYVTQYSQPGALENWTVFLRASPILLMIISQGSLLAIQILNLLIMVLSMKAVFDSLQSFNGRMLFLLFSLLLPYYVLGFLSLNKEVYAMCAAMLYISYMVRGQISHLIVAVLLALAARYYMVAALLLTMIAIPRHGAIRYLWIIAALLGISAVAPLIKTFIPEYSYVNLLEGSGRTAAIFAEIVDNFGYALLYPFKYGTLLLVRPFSYLTGNTSDLIGAIVSALSILMIVIVGWLVASHKRLPEISRRLILAGFVAPIPLMWSEIMHWRYYSFVYFFFLMAWIVYLEDKQNRRQQASEPAPYELT